jgi:hypothetical protein
MSQAANLGALGTNAGTTGILPAAGGGTAGTNGAIGFKNRIINSGMGIDQRNNGGSVTATSSEAYTVDRWACYSSPSSKFTVQRNGGAVTPPAGFTYYLGITSSSAYTVTSSDWFSIEQAIEGYNIIDLAWGTASAKAVSLSFQVYSSLTGTFGGSVRNSAANRSYPFTFTVSSANTWTTISIAIAGDTSGTWTSTNAAGLWLFFDMGAGTGNRGTAGAWASANYVGATSSTVQVVANNAATFYITGVQFEAGSTATNYDFRSYVTELMFCYRYYFDTASQTNGGAGSGLLGAMMVKSFNGNEAAGFNKWPTPMRATPTITCFGNNGTAGQLHRFASGDVGTNINFNNVTYNGFTAVNETGTFTTTEPNMYGGRIIANAEI